MEIGPVNNGKAVACQPDGRKGQETVADRGSQPADDVNISNEARERLQQQKIELDQERPVKDNAERGPELVRLVRERIDSGFYDRVSVREETLERLIDEMLENINQYYK